MKDIENIEEVMNFTETVLAKIRMQFVEDVTDDMLEPFIEVDKAAAMILNRVVVKVHGYVWGKESVHQSTVHYPKTWWQHFKKTFAPMWALRRWPVQHESISVDCTAIYPTLKIERHEPQLVYRQEAEK